MKADEAAFLAACYAALEYDAAIQRIAKHGHQWVNTPELDRLYEDWIEKTRRALALYATLKRTS